MINDHVSTIQLINTVLNLFGVFGLALIATVIWDYRKKQKLRYEFINKRLDHILVLSHEVYETEVKEKANKALDPKAAQAIPRETVSEIKRSIKL